MAFMVNARLRSRKAWLRADVLCAAEWPIIPKAYDRNPPPGPVRTSRVRDTVIGLLIRARSGSCLDFRLKGASPGSSTACSRALQKFRSKSVGPTNVVVYSRRRGLGESALPSPAQLDKEIVPLNCPDCESEDARNATS
jgi:hypothetical protein